MAADTLNVGITRVRIKPGEEESVDDAITRGAIRSLVKDGSIYILPKKGVSRGRWKSKKTVRKRMGSRKGRTGARLDKKTKWVSKVRTIRRHVKIMVDRGEINTSTKKTLYKQLKGGLIRNLRHLRELVKANSK